LRIVDGEGQEPGDGGLDYHLGDARLGNVGVVPVVVADAGEGADAGAVGSGVEIGGGLRHFELLLAEPQVDAALGGLDLTDDLLLGDFEGGLLDVELGVGVVAFVLVGGDARLGDGLVERCLGLLKGGLFCWSCCSAALESKPDHDVALVDHGAGGGQPGDAELRNDGA